MVKGGKGMQWISRKNCLVSAVVFVMALFLSSSVSLAEQLRVTEPVVNVRSGPGVKHKAVSQVKKNDILERIKSEKGWSKIKLPNGKIAWISEKYVTALAFKNEPDGFGGIQWGTNIDEIDDMHLIQDGVFLQLYSRLGDNQRIGSVQLSQLLYGFYGGRFSDVMIRVDPAGPDRRSREKAMDDFERLKDNLFKQYGEPKTAELANPLKGERVDKYQWVGANVQVALSFDLVSKVTLLKYWYTPIHSSEMLLPSQWVPAVRKELMKKFR